ncbi:metallophosphoesterase [bacterium]|nr:metallophosphoesterase [bacterium]
MRHTGWIFFLAVALVFYAGVNFIILNKIRKALKGWSPGREIILSLFFLWALSFPAARILRAESSGLAGFVLQWFGSAYMAVMAWSFLVILIAELLWLLRRLFRIPVFRDPADNQRAMRSFVLITLACMAVAIVFGSVQMRNLHVRSMDISLDKPAGPVKELRVAVVSDVHLGSLIGPAYLKRIADSINVLNPDLVLWVGDLVDERITGELGEKCAEIFRSVRSRYGCFAVTGNHEYFEGKDEAVAFMRRGNLTVLEDSVAVIENSVCLIGRKDRQDHHRKSLQALMKNCNPALPVIVMDHQPIGLGEAEKNRVDLQISGHSHAGQLIPFIWTAQAGYELHYGWKKKGDTQIVVTAGAGTWGPPLRIGTRPEILLLKIRFGGS